MKNVIITIAVGDNTWAQRALNLCLSIKANEPEQEILVIYSEACMKGMEEYFALCSEYGYCTSTFDFTTSHELAFYLKTQLYDIATKAVPDADAFIFLDADTLVIPGRKVGSFFEKHKDRDFTAYCNDIYDYETKIRSRRDYTFWCDIEKAKKYWYGVEYRDMLKIPQINSSFLYFKKDKYVKKMFGIAETVWNNDKMPYIPYKGVKPDELCFNIACSLSDIFPHQITYRPIFFQFASEQQSVENLMHYYKMFGFAGTEKHADYLVNIYNEWSAYYRTWFGINLEYKFSNASVVTVDPNPIGIKPLKRRTIFRSGEVENSDGGCFNPDGIMINGELMTIMRKEKNLDVYYGRYQYHTSIPFVYFDESNNYELELSGFDSRLRVEDFRLFQHNGKLLCNHAIIIKDEVNDRHIVSALSYIEDNKLRFWHIPRLPITTGKLEKNWVFFSEGNRIYLIYSLSPYRLFYLEDGSEEWKEYIVPEQELSFWFHDSFICNSTNPVLIDNYYLVFFHTKERMIYHHGAALIDKDTKEIIYYTKNSITVKDYAQGLHAGLLYVSGCELISENTIRLMFGESDSHACYNDYDKETLITAIINNHERT